MSVNWLGPDSGTGTMPAEDYKNYQLGTSLVSENARSTLCPQCHRKFTRFSLPVMMMMMMMIVLRSDALFVFFLRSKYYSQNKQPSYTQW
jgi:hypothetical protein